LFLSAALAEERLVPVAEPRGPLDGYKYLLFSQTYRAADRYGRWNDVVLLGYYEFLDDQNLTMNYWTFDGNKNVKPGTTAVRHPRMLVLPGQERAVPGAFHIPTYAAFDRFKGTWASDGKQLRIRVGQAIHKWDLQDGDEHLYKVAGSYANAADDTNTIAGITYSNGYGYGYLSQEATRKERITRDELSPTYKGELYVRKDEETVAWRWGVQSTGLTLRAFQSFGNGDLLGYVKVDQKMNPPMATHTTLLLNYSPFSKQLIYVNGGHDFNRNGVFDEVGHTTEILGVYENGRMPKMVFIEYSYQTNGRPLMGVGRYYTASKVDVAAPKNPPAER
jgi:hypothetical protein